MSGDMSDEVAGPASVPDRRSVLSGGLWRAASTVVPMFSALALTVVISHALGPVQLGNQSLIAYVQGLALNVAVLSVTQAAIQSIAAARGIGDDNVVAWLSRWSLRVHVLTGGAITVSMLVFAALAAGRLPWVVVGVTALVDAVAYALTSRIVPSCGWAPVSRRRIVSQVLGPALGVVGVLLGLGVAGAFAGQGIGSLYLLGSLLVFVRRAGPVAAPRRTGPAPAVRPLLRLTVGFVAALLLAQVVERRVEVLFLNAYRGLHDVAMFSAATTVVSVAVTACVAVTGAAMPAVAAARARLSADELTERLGHPLRVVLTGSVLLFSGVLSLGPDVVLLMFGSEFGQAAGTVRLLSPGLLLAPVAGVLTAYWLGIGRASTVVLANAAGAVVDVGLCLALIPPVGLEGAVVATLGAQAVATGVLAIRSRRPFSGTLRRPVWLLRVGAVAVLAGLATTGVAVLLPPAVAAPVGSCVFGAVTLAGGLTLGLLRADDAAWLRGLLPGPLGSLTVRMGRSAS